ncbi:MAG: IS66 family transposase [Leptolyngbya sp. SIO3F4]|nr:IS66 family transposase [Leptolyngbya sp. SIO3F4]
MSEEIEISGITVLKADWEATPPSIRALVLLLSERLRQQDERIHQLEERLNQTSKNSSKPPSNDGFGQSSGKQKKGRKRTSQGRATPSPRQARRLQPSELCDQVKEVVPSVCTACGASLNGHDQNPHRHQEIELPPMEPMVIEYRLHQLSCHACGHLTRASLPRGVSPSGYGERLSAIVALLSGPYRHSYRQVCALMRDLFDVSLSRGSVGRLRDEMSEALRAPVADAKAYVHAQSVIQSDETSFPQGNRDGANPKRTKGWLWVLVTPLVSFFEVVLSRSQTTSKALIGESYRGIVTSDRYSAYGWIALGQRQVCWAHLKRDLTAIAERIGASHEIGEALLRRQHRLFRWWHRVRDGTLSREQFIRQVTYLRQGFKAALDEAAALPIDPHEKSPFAKTVRTCRRLLKVEPALWTFVSTVGVEPTNNAAERALRPAVIWRKTSFGAQSQRGSQFVARLMTVTTSLKVQGRNILDFLAQACLAARTGKEPPALIPQQQR